MHELHSARAACMRVHAGTSDSMHCCIHTCCIARLRVHVHTGAAGCEFMFLLVSSAESIRGT